MSTNGWRHLSGALLLTVVFAVGSCDKSEQTRLALADRRDEWSHRLSALRAQESDLEARFQALPPPPAADDANRARHHRLEATIAGSRQTLADVTIHVDDSVHEVEAAIARGGMEGEEALAAVSARMGEYLHRQEEELASGAEALIHVADGR